MDFAVSADITMKIKENEKRNKNHDLARESRNQWNMSMTVMPNVIGALGTVSKGLERGLEELEIGGRAKTIQTIALLRSARILRRFLKT